MQEVDADQFFRTDLPEMMRGAGDDEVLEVRLNGPENPVDVTLEKVGTGARELIAAPVVRPDRTTEELLQEG